jgi:hypothetical protein
MGRLAATVVFLGCLLAAPLARADVSVFSYSGGSSFGGITTGPNGHVYITTQEFVEEYDQNGVYVRQIGSKGTGNGAFDRPADVVVDASANVYVADFGGQIPGNNVSRLQKFTAAGTFDWSVTIPFQSTWTLSMSQSGEIWGTEINNGQVTRYSVANGSVTGGFPVPGGQPSDVAFDPQGNLWIYVAGPEQLRRYTPQGVLVETSGRSIPYTTSGPNTQLGNDASYGLYASSIGSVVHYDAQGNFAGRLDTANRNFRGIAEGTEGVVFTNSNDIGGGVLALRITPTPTPALTASRNPALSGDTVEFDASGSQAPLALLQKYEWDLDGDGSFETDSGASPKVTRTYPARQVVDIGLRVTANNGRSASTRVPLDVRLSPPAGAVGVSINGGAQFTNDPNVSLRVIWPAFSRTLTTSNDGGFAGATQALVAPELPWRLDSSGPERLPKTVYLRFDDSTQTFQDDIILDQVPPQVTAASAGPASASASAVKAHRIRLIASDDNSGVGVVQFAVDRKKPGKEQPYAAALTVRAAAPPKFARVRDRAGNFSAWRQIARSSLVVAKANVRRGAQLILNYRALKATSLKVKLISGSKLARTEKFELGRGSGKLRIATARLRKGKYRLRATLDGVAYDIAFRVV